MAKCLFYQQMPNHTKSNSTTIIDGFKKLYDTCKSIPGEPDINMSLRLQWYANKHKKIKANADCGWNSLP